MASDRHMGPSPARLQAALDELIGAAGGDGVISAVRLIGDGEGVLPEEMALVARAVERRRDEFAAGRACAREALSALGCPPVPILTGRLREPLWPPGFAGSISHDGRYAAAIAYPSRTGAIRLALDLMDRHDRDVFREIAAVIAQPDEAPAGDGEALARLFSAKEAAIKILSPRRGALLDFRHLRAREAPGGYEIAMERDSAVIAVRLEAVAGVLLSVAALR